MFPELQHAWKLVKTAILIFGVLLSGAACIEILHAYVILREIHPVLGYIFAGFLAALLLGFMIYLYVAIGQRPRVLVPPQIADPHQASEKELLAYVAYLRQYTERLACNPALPPEECQMAFEAIPQLDGLFEQTGEDNIPYEKIRDYEENVIDPLLSTLDAQAEKQIRGSVRDIMLAVTLSPFRAVDLIVVLYRNALMVVRVIGIYNSRPFLREQLAIFRDTLRVVAAVNFLSFGEKFTEQLFSRVPFVGQVMDDLIQGIGAGLLTSATGHAALHRCRAFTGWDREEATQHMAKMMTAFLADTRDMFTKDVLPRVKPRLSAMDAWERVTIGFSGAFEATGAVMDTFVTKPAIAGTNAFAYAGRATFRGVAAVGKTAVVMPVRGVQIVGRQIYNGAKSTTRSIKRLFVRE